MSRIFAYSSLIIQIAGLFFDDKTIFKNCVLGLSCLILGLIIVGYRDVRCFLPNENKKLIVATEMLSIGFFVFGVRGLVLMILGAIG